MLQLHIYVLYILYIARLEVVYIIIYSHASLVTIWTCTFIYSTQRAFYRTHLPTNACEIKLLLSSFFPLMPGSQVY